jgi:hypothetical protein
MEKIKLTITLDIEVPNVMNKYVITRSNYTDAYVLGVPLKIISQPYVGEYTLYPGKTEKKLYIKVASLITGYIYEIPLNSDWMTIYDTYEEMVIHCAGWISRGYKIYQDAGRLEQIVNKEYYPMDNSYSCDFEGKWFPVAGKLCRILSVPFKVSTEFGKEKCILVQKKEAGSPVGRAYFMEWKLLP